MEEKVIKKIETQCPFPLLIYKTIIKYNEVRKASGIAYILLELISKQQSDIRFREALLKFGIPIELHSLFGGELAGMISTKIIQSRFSSEYFVNPKYFGEITVEDVKLTEKGKKLFREGAIPTGMEKGKAKEIYFSPVTRKFDIQCNTQYSPISNSFLGEEFMDKVDIDISGLEDYLNANTTKVGLKAEERIISFSVEEPQKMNVRVEGNLTMNIYPSYMEFTFATSDEKAFFDKYYSSKIMAKGMLMKDKFKFANLSEPLPKINLAKIQNLASLYLPNEFAKLAKTPCVIFLQREGMCFERNDDVICVDKKLSSKLLDKINKNAKFALLAKSDCKYYCAANVVMPCKNFGDNFELPLVTESIVQPNTLREILKQLYEYYSDKPFNDEVGRVVTYVVDSLGDTEYFDKFIAKQLQLASNVDEQISKLLLLDSAFKKHSAWKQCFAKTMSRLYDKSISEVAINNVIYKNTVLKPLKEKLQISNIDYVRKFSENICKSEPIEIVYEALDSAEFSDMEILSVANVIEMFMTSVLQNEKIVSETNLASKYKTLQVNLWKINQMLGIIDNAEYTIKYDYNVDEFLNAYSTLHSALKAVEKYKQFATKEYGELSRYIAIYEPIHEILSIERTASLQPEKITKKYIDTYIARAKYKDAICDLYIKLQFDLRNLLKADKSMKAVDLIDNALAKKIIDKSQVDALHKLRICRNGFQHPELNQIPFDKKTVENWCDIVFMIGGKK